MQATQSVCSLGSTTHIGPTIQRTSDKSECCWDPSFLYRVNDGSGAQHVDMLTCWDPSFQIGYRVKIGSVHNMQTDLLVGTLHFRLDVGLKMGVGHNMQTDILVGIGHLKFVEGGWVWSDTDMPSCQIRMGVTHRHAYLLGHFISNRRDCGQIQTCLLVGTLHFKLCRGGGGVWSDTDMPSCLDPPFQIGIRARIGMG